MTYFIIEYDFDSTSIEHGYQRHEKCTYSSVENFMEGYKEIDGSPYCSNIKTYVAHAEEFNMPSRNILDAPDEEMDTIDKIEYIKNQLQENLNRLTGRPLRDKELWYEIHDMLMSYLRYLNNKSNK